MSKKIPYHRKRLGQIFLRDALVVERILQSASLAPDDLVLEVGPGRGILTAALAQRTQALYAIEVVSYLTAGILLWLQLIESPPLRPQLAPLRRVVLVLAVATSGTVLGLIRVYSAGLVYPVYLGFRHHVLSVVADQQVGGAVLWVIPLVPLSVLAVALAIGWLQDEESEATAAGIDRLLRQNSAWPSGPGPR